MKTFKQFLQEAEAVELAELLNGPSKDFFQRSRKEGLLIRGMKDFGRSMGKVKVGDSEFSYYKKTVRKERAPMDTAHVIHEIVDDWFEDKTGIRARSQAVFCFGERGRETAMEYGKPAVILPIGKIAYAWSPKVADLYDDVIRGKLQTSVKFDGSKAGLKPEYIGSDGKPDLEKIHDLLNSLGYTINGMEEAVASSKEIMIECDEYFVIPYEVTPEGDMPQLQEIKQAFVKA